MAWWLAAGFALALGAVTNLAANTPGSGTFAHLILLVPPSRRPEPSPRRGSGAT